MGAVTFNICSSLLLRLSTLNTTVIHSPLHITTQPFEAAGCRSPLTAELFSPQFSRGSLEPLDQMFLYSLTLFSQVSTRRCTVTWLFLIHKLKSQLVPESLAMEHNCPNGYIINSSYLIYQIRRHQGYFEYYTNCVQLYLTQASPSYGLYRLDIPSILS